MRTKRLFGAAIAAAAVAIAPLSAPIVAAQEVSGVGTGTVGATVLRVEVGEGGNVLAVRVLGDDGSSTTDPSNGTPNSATSLRPLSISSQLVPALNVESPAVSTSSTGAEDSENVSSPDVAAGPAFSGSLAATLSSVVDSVGARSGLDATLSNLGVAGGLLSVPNGTVALATNAAKGDASAVRGISIPSIEVLNLAAVLEGLGLPLGGLSVQDLLDLLGGLGIPLPADLPASPEEVIATVDGAIDYLQTQSGDLTATICGQVDTLLGPLGGLAGTSGVEGTVDGIVDTVNDSTGGVLDGVIGSIGTLSAQALPVSCTELVGTVNDLIDDLQEIVGELVASVLALLGDTALLSVSGIDVGLTAKSAPTVESSIADVTGTIGEVKVGALTLPALSGLDLTSALDVLAAAGDTITAAVGDVLATVNADLAGLVDVDVMDIQELVTTEGAYTKATAAVTALTATITPPDVLGAALSVEDTAAGVLGEVGATVPALAPVMGQLEAALGGLDLLTAPTTITVGQLTSSSAFRPLAAGESAPAPGGELPRTGTNAAVPAMAAVLVAGVALGIRRWVAAVATD